jgi:hypothetical protein
VFAHPLTRPDRAERGSTFFDQQAAGLRALIDCRNLQAVSVHGTHRVSPGVLEHGLDVRPEMPIRSKRAEVCTEAAMSY